MDKSKKTISQDDKYKMLSNASFHLRQGDPYYGNLLQEILIKYSEQVPTLGIGYNVKNSQYEIVINPHYFAKVSPENRVALFQHELQHFTHKHLFRFPFLKETTSPEDRGLYNVAGDLAINQYIPNLPDGCDVCRHAKMKGPEDWKKVHITPELEEACPGKGLFIKDWLCHDGTPFPALRSMEEYYGRIKEELKKQTGKDGQPKPQDGSSEAKGKKPGDETTKGNVAQNLQGGAKSIDEHEWDSLDEKTKEKMLDEAKKLIKRSIEKTQHSYTKIPDAIKDLLQEIEVLSAKINHKDILRRIIKKTISHSNRENTWKKPNKRYGIVAPGNKNGTLPFCTFYNDSSGSISVTEQNTYLNIMAGFLKVGTRNCWLAFWHTSLYLKQKYKLNQALDASKIESGGTDITCVMEDIKKTRPDCAFVLTDGYYDSCDTKITSEVVFIISEDGNENHPMKHVGKTILLENLK